MESPYASQPIERWRSITESLVEAHPLKLATIRDVTLSAWQLLWETKIGVGATAIELANLDVPATVVGYFLEKLLAQALATRFPDEWRGQQSKDDKDLVYIPDPSFSAEMKCSGQGGTRIYGNRSYGQELMDLARTAKDKSGYYLTVNFYGQTITLIRFGWIDAGDWKPQRSATGQMAGLADSVYEHKLVMVPGEYQLMAPVWTLPGLGAVGAARLSECGIRTVGDLCRYEEPLPERLQRCRRAALQFVSFGA